MDGTGILFSRNERHRMDGTRLVNLGSRGRLVGMIPSNAERRIRPLRDLLVQIGETGANVVI